MFEGQFIKDLRALGFREGHTAGYYHYNTNQTGVARSTTHVYYNPEVKGILIQYDINFTDPRQDTVNYVLANTPVVAASLFFNIILTNEVDVDKVKAIAGLEIQNEAKTTAGKLIAGKITGPDVLTNSYVELSKLGKFLPKWIVKPKMFVLCTDAHFSETFENYKRNGDPLHIMEKFYAAINGENFVIITQMKKKKDFVTPYEYAVHPGVGTHQAY